MKNRALLACACTTLLFGAARAQDSKDKDAAVLDEARQHVAKAKVHYDLGEFKDAADEYILVYRLRPIPALLFNIAQAYRQAGLYDKARQFYKSYLRESPEAKNKAMIEQAVREMDELIAKERHAKDGPPTGVKVPPEATLPMEKMAGTPSPKPAVTLPATLPATPPAATPPAAPVTKPPEQQVAAKPPPVVVPPTASKPPTPAPVAQAAPVTQPAVKTTGQEIAMAPPIAAKPAVTTPPAPRPAAPPAATTPQPAPVHAEKEGGSHLMAWVLTGSSVALIGGGGLFFTKASSADSDLQNNLHTRAEADSLISQSKSSHTVSVALLGLGVAVAAGAVVLFLLPSGDSK